MQRTTRFKHLSLNIIFTKDPQHLALQKRGSSVKVVNTSKSHAWLPRSMLLLLLTPSTQRNYFCQMQGFMLCYIYKSKLVFHVKSIIWKLEAENSKSQKIFIYKRLLMQQRLVSWLDAWRALRAEYRGVMLHVYYQTFCTAHIAFLNATQHTQDHK